MSTHPTTIPCAEGGDCGGNCNICEKYPRPDVSLEPEYKAVLRQAFIHVETARQLLREWECGCPELSKSRDTVVTELGEPLALWSSYANSQ